MGESVRKYIEGRDIQDLKWEIPQIVNSCGILQLCYFVKKVDAIALNLELHVKKVMENMVLPCEVQGRKLKYYIIQN